MIGNSINKQPISKCSYCNKENAKDELIINTWNGTGRKDVAFKYCSDNCKHGIEIYATHLNKNVRIFLILILLGILCIIIFPLVAAILQVKNGLVFSFGFPIFLFGIVFIKYPFSTPETNQMWGIKRSQRILKNIGWALALIGITFLLINCIEIIS